MDTLQKDIAQLDMVENKRNMTLMDLVGSDLDGQQYKDAMETTWANDIQSISQGGNLQVGSQSVTIVLRPQCSESILRLDTMCIVGRFQGSTGTEFPINALSLFRPISFKISNFTKAYAYGEQYCQQVLESINADCISPWKRGLWIGQVDPDGSAYFSLQTTAAAAQSSLIEQDIYNLRGTTGALGGGVVNVNFTQLYQTLMNHYGLTKQADSDRNFAVPVWLIFYPLLQALDWNLYCKFPGQIEFQLQTVPQSENIVQINAFAPGTPGTYTVPGGLPGAYTLSNLYLFYQYSRLNNSPLLNQAILTNELEYRPEYPISYSIPWSPTNTLIFNAARQTRIHAVIFAINANSANRSGTQLINSAETLYEGNQYSGDCILFPAMRINQIVIQASGRVITLNSQAIAGMQLIPGSQTGAINMPYSDGQGYCQSNLFKFLRTAYMIDLRKYELDMIGSSSGQVENIVVQIQWNQSEDLSIYGPTIGNTSAVPNLTGYNVVGHVIVSSKMIQRDGDYYEASI